MLAVLGAIAKALRDLTHPRVLTILLIPMLGAIVLWVALSWYFWGAWTSALGSLFSDTAFARWIADYGLRWMVEGASAVFVFALVVAATLITAMLITELVAMPVIVSVIERQYVHLEKENSSTALGSLGNAAIAISSFGVLWLLTLPLWLTGIGAFLVPPLLSAYLNQRLFRYDALAEHASREEYRAIVARARGRLFALGLALSVVYYIPLVNLIAPVLSGLAFTHLCLGELGRLRARA